MAITFLDGILIGVTLLSAFLAMLRGFSREVLSVASWVVSAIAAFLYYTLPLDFVSQYIRNEALATVASAAIVFLVVLIVVSFITIRIADFIIDSRIGPLDRTLGFIFGAVRGLLIVVIGTLFLNWILQNDQPAWIANAKSKPLLDNIGLRLQDLMPDDGGQSVIEKFTGNEEAETAPIEDGTGDASEGSQQFTDDTGNSAAQTTN